SLSSVESSTPQPTATSLPHSQHVRHSAAGHTDGGSDRPQGLSLRPSFAHCLDKFLAHRARPSDPRATHTRPLLSAVNRGALGHGAGTVERAAVLDQVAQRGATGIPGEDPYPNAAIEQPR